MSKISRQALSIIFITCISFLNAQVQIGSDIDGKASGDFSGTSVSINSNGTVVAIGSYGNDGNGSDAGHVRIYKNDTGVWTQIGADIDGEAANDNSGTSVSLSSDGSTVAIGAPFNNGNGNSAGHVRIFKNISGTWTQVGLDIDGESPGDYSGSSVSLSSDGSTVAIGAPQNDGNGANAGHVRIFKNISGTWTKIGSDIDGEAADDYSAVSVSLSSDGSTVAIGAPYNDGNGADAGHVRVYTIGTANVSEISINKDYAVYPNPTKGVVFIKAKASLLGATYTVYSSNGAEVLSGSITTEVTTLGIQDLAEGVYLISVGNDLKQTFRVIKE
jgi:hypothetical protein